MKLHVRVYFLLKKKKYLWSLVNIETLKMIKIITLVI